MQFERSLDVRGKLDQIRSLRTRRSYDGPGVELVGDHDCDNRENSTLFLSSRSLMNR